MKCMFWKCFQIREERCLFFNHVHGGFFLR
jgi:hypothetical protein